MQRLLFILFALLSPLPLRACELALLLAVDISGSVEPDEYRIQMDGIAAGLRDGVVSEALVRGNSAVALVQWTGSSRQQLSVPWTRIGGFADVETLARRVSGTPRAWRSFSTAIGEALRFALPTFDAVADCRRWVIDVSGDGRSNEGVEPAMLRAALNRAGVTVNALVIEGADRDLTGYYWENVITGEGAFVMTANDFSEYPERMRRKLRRETARQMSSLEWPGARRVD